jgi:circadian clock protein KaiB
MQDRRDSVRETGSRPHAEEAGTDRRDVPVGGEAPDSARNWVLRLYVATDSPRSERAERNLRRLFRRHLPDCRLEVVNILEQPERACEDAVVAVPTLVRHSPLPRRRLIGDMSNEAQVLSGLGLV